LSNPILTTKLYIPPTQPQIVPRWQLVEKLNEGLHRKLTLISAPASFGKTMMVTEWLGNLREDETLAKSEGGADCN
jgi:LuxR family maltose regulon positive regulatory protein